MNLQTQIQPINTTKPATTAICQYVTVLFGEGDQYANARILLNDSDGNTIAANDVAFTEAELADWGNDDQVVLTKALAKLQIEG